MTGWTWDHVYWNLDLPRLAALTRYWKNNPPAHVCLKILAMDRRLKAGEDIAGDDSGPTAAQLVAGATPIKLDPDAVRKGLI